MSDGIATAARLRSAPPASVQITELVCKDAKVLIDEDDTSGCGAQDTQWNICSLTRDDHQYFAICILHNVFNQMEGTEWEEYSMFCFDCEGIPFAEIDIFESQLLGIQAAAFLKFSVFDLYRFPHTAVQAGSKALGPAGRECAWRDILTMEACCRRDPSFIDRVVTFYPSSSSISAARPQGFFKELVEIAISHSLKVEKDNFSRFPAICQLPGAVCHWNRLMLGFKHDSCLSIGLAAAVRSRIVWRQWHSTLPTCARN